MIPFSSDANRKSTLQDAVEEALSTMADVKELRPLSEGERSQVLLLEAQAEQSGAAGGMMEMVNEGIREALGADHVFLALTGHMHTDPPQAWTLMLDESDQVVGEWLPQRRISEAEKNDACRFISRDFVLYTDRETSGKVRFVMPCIPLEIHPDHPDLYRCGAGCPSAPADEYLRQLLGDPGKEYATLIIGVWLEDGEED